jgi:hypothetical protein
MAEKAERKNLSMKPEGKTLLEMINDQQPDRDFTRKDVCSMVCEEVDGKCSCSWLDFFTQRRFLEVTM